MLLAESHHWFIALAGLDLNAINNYYSHYNSLRVGKGFIYALLFLPLLKKSHHNTAETKKLFAYGLLAGLVAVILVSGWERFIFPGIFNFSSVFRISALFSSMHTGGGHIDAYLVLTLPFIALLFAGHAHVWKARLLGCLLFFAGL